MTDQLRRESDKLWSAEPIFLPAGKTEKLGDPWDRAMAKEKPEAMGNLGIPVQLGIHFAVLRNKPRQRVWHQDTQGSTAGRSL